MSLMTGLYKLYGKSPLFLKNSVGFFYNTIPDKYRYGLKFASIIKYLKETEYMGREELEELQNRKFIEIIQEAYSNVPYYNKLFNEHGLDINSFKDLRDIKKIPFLTKDIIRDNFEDMVSKKVDKSKLKYITTGGTSGKPFGLYIDYDNDLVEWAYMTNLWSRIGYDSGSTRLVLRGKAFENMKKGIPWQYDSIKRELSISIFDMTEANMRLYVELINKFKPEYFHCYMSAIYLLCTYMENNSLSIGYDIKGVIAVSENVYPHQIEYVEKILKTRVFSFYGHSERIILAGECECSREYHATPQYGYTEIIDNSGNSIKDNSLGELVGTGFNNTGMPFIRYKTGDLARWSVKQECKCNRNHPLIQRIEGRWKQEMLVKADNSLISMTALNIHSDVFNSVEQFQLYQDRPGLVILKLLPGKSFNHSCGEIIKSELKNKTGDGIEYIIAPVQSIENKSNGKFIFVDQRLEISKF